jgi:hypothetical protein
VKTAIGFGWKCNLFPDFPDPHAQPNPYMQVFKKFKLSSRLYGRHPDAGMISKNFDREQPKLFSPNLFFRVLHPEVLHDLMA